MKTSETTSKIWQAILEAQTKIDGITKAGHNPQFKNKYAKIEDIMSAIRKPLADAGLVLVQYVEGNFLVTKIVHAESSEFVESSLEMIVEKNTMQGLGSAITYARRYSILSILCIGDESSEDDGNAASERKQPQPPPQPPKKLPARLEKQKENLPGVYELTEEFKELVASSTRKELREKYKSFTEGQQRYIVNYLNSEEGQAQVEAIEKAKEEAKVEAESQNDQ